MKEPAMPKYRLNLFTWFINNARWYGAEWYITLLGGVLLVGIILVTIFASSIAPYDPIKFVGAPFNRPGTQQSILVPTGDNTTQSLDDLTDQQIGVVQNTQAARELEQRDIAFRPFSSAREAVAALTGGSVDALVADVGNPAVRAEQKAHASQIKVVGKPFGATYILGTDSFGRDVYSRMIHGARTVLAIAILSALMSALIGVPVGLFSGFAGGAIDKVLSLVMDSIYSFPGLILAIAMAALLGPGLINISVAIAVVYIPTYFRMVRGKTLSVKEDLYVEAARSLGAKALTILRIYVFPNVIPSIVVIFSVNVADSILTEAGLSFLGLGLPPPIPDWGFDLASGKRFLPSGYWWIITYPGMMIALVTLAFSMLGEGLNEILNPRLTEN